MMKFRAGVVGWLVVALTIPAASEVLAQTRPDAGTLRQQIETERNLELPKKLAPEKPAEPSAMKAAPGVTLTVTVFRFVGNTLLSTEQLEPVVADYLNRPVDFDQLQAAAAAVAEAYRNAGWVVRVYLPQQDVTAGIVTIQVVEAVFGGTDIEKGEPTRVAAERIVAIVDAQQKKGAALNSDAIDRALLLANDLPGVTTAGNLKAGKNSQETDLALKLADKPYVGGDFGLDGYGARSTGPIRYTANGTLNSPLGLGELASANLLHTAGSDYARFALYAPIGDDGLRVGANASRLYYRLVSQEFKILQADGNSDSVGVEANYPIIRSRLRNLYAALNYDHKTFDNESAGAITSKYGIDSYTAGLNGNLFDNFAGGGANSASVALIVGRVDLHGSPNQGADILSTRTGGDFGKLHYGIGRQQVVTEDFSVFAGLSGQMSNKNLDSSEKLYLGGQNAVRAYPVNEGGGSEGHVANVELRQKLPEGFSAIGFFDWGRIIVNHDNHFAGAAAPNGYNLQGAGLSLAWLSEFGLNLKAIWAHRIGDNPNPTNTGKDQDGSLIRNRWWVMANFQF